jgi:energy-coupling factor transporter transmembrane protein EcfT
MLMPKKLILALVSIVIGCFLGIHFSNPWLTVIAIPIFLSIFFITKDKRLLKIVVPVSVLIIVGAFIFGIFGRPSAEEIKNRLNVSEIELVKMKTDLTKKQEQLSIEKKKQGWFKSTFKDSEKVNYLESQVELLQNEIVKLEEELFELKEELRKHG